MNGVELLTLLLAVATAWMAFETRRMSIATEKAVKLELTPALAFVRVEATFSGDQVKKKIDGLRINLVLSNPGKVPVTYCVTNLSCTFDGLKLEGGSYSNQGGIVHAGRETSFFSPGFKCDGRELKVGMQAEIGFEIEFWSDSSERYMLSQKLLATVERVEPFFWSWLNLNWPKYGRR